MNQVVNKINKKWPFRWRVPLVVAIACMVWEIVAVGFDIGYIIKANFTFVGLSIFYQWLVTWLKDKRGQRPPTIELVLALPIFAFIIFATVPPFAYIRPFFLTAVLTFIGYVICAFALGFLLQEKGLQNICTVTTTAVVVNNIKERINNRPGKISPPTYFPVLVYYVDGERMERKYDHGQPRPMALDRRVDICYNPKNPKEICFKEQKENKALTFGVLFAMVIGIAVLIAAALSFINKWSF